MGKVLLAHLDEERLSAFFAISRLVPMTKRTICTELALRQELAAVRERGYAIADQESEDGVRTVAVPLYDRRHRVAAAMNVSGHSSRVSMRELKGRFLPALIEAAKGASAALGAHAERLYKR
jgi:IclR family pca regulon transcriptional regulator